MPKWLGRDKALMEAVEPKPVNPFKVGDWVKLKDKNPFKGTLRADISYEVIRSYGNVVMLRASNGTGGMFEFRYFEESGRGVDQGAVEEYEEAIKAQELLGL